MVNERQGPIRQRVDLDSGGARSGDPNDAIVEIRKRLGSSFREHEPSWKENVRAATEALREKWPVFPDESEASYLERLKRYAIAQKAPFVQAIERKVRLFAFLLGRSENVLVRDDILPHLDYWHHRSGTAVDFVCLGFSDSASGTWDAKAFTQIVRMFSTELNWQYSGETDILIFNGRYHADSGEAMLDLSQVVAMTLEHAIEDKAILSVSAFMENIIAVTERHRGDNPAWALSDHHGIRLAGSALKKFLLTLLPEWIRDDAARGLHFHVRDLDRTTDKS